jgi:hypothetical protein
LLFLPQSIFTSPALLQIDASNHRKRQHPPDRGGKRDAKHCTGNPFYEALLSRDLFRIPKNDEHVLWEISDEQLVNGLIVPAGHNAEINCSTRF